MKQTKAERNYNAPKKNIEPRYPEEIDSLVVRDDYDFIERWKFRHAPHRKLNLIGREQFYYRGRLLEGYRYAVAYSIIDKMLRKEKGEKNGV